MKNIEIWKDVVGYEGFYKISSIGNIKSLDRYVNCRGGRKICYGKTLKPHLDRDGYLKIEIGRNEPKAKKYFIHSLVAKAFLPNPNNFPQVNHIDGNKFNNQIENLQWCDVFINNKHAFDTGLNKSFGENHKDAKLKITDVLEIKKLMSAAQESKNEINQRKELAARFNVSISLIRHITANKIWKMALKAHLS